jgi:hypothetical protein
MNGAIRRLVIYAGLFAALGVVSGPDPATAVVSKTTKQKTTQDQQMVAHRGDVINLPDDLKDRLVELAGRPHSYLPLTVFAEAPTPSQLFAYYLLDTTGFQPNVFTTTIVGINDGTAPTATGPNHDLPTIAAVRLVVEPKPGLPTDPNDPGAFIDIFTDISGLFVINNESGWYEGWMIHDLVVPPVAPPRGDGSEAQFGTITAADAAALALMGGSPTVPGNNVPGHLFTVDGKAPHPPSATDQFPTSQTNLVSLFLSMGAYNCLQQSDCHAYWEFNQYTDWVFPPYELPFTGGFGAPFISKEAFNQGKLAFLTSVVPGSGPGVGGTGPTGPGPTGGNDPKLVGDDPDNPRDPDRLLDTSPADPDRPAVNNPDHKEKRLRFIPSGLTREILVDAYMRPVSFELGVTDIKQRLFDATVKEIARIDQNGDGIISPEEADLEDQSDTPPLPNDRLYIPAPQFQRFAVTREINDGLLAPRFAPSQRAWVLSGSLTLVSPAVDASIPQDADNR